MRVLSAPRLVSSAMLAITAVLGVAAPSSAQVVSKDVDIVATTADPDVRVTWDSAAHSMCMKVNAAVGRGYLFVTKPSGDSTGFTVDGVGRTCQTINFRSGAPAQVTIQAYYPQQATVTKYWSVYAD